MFKRTEEQIKRREAVEQELTAIKHRWEVVKQHIDEITKLIGMDGADAVRAFFVLSTQNGNHEDPVEPLSAWTDRRLTQLEGLESLTPEQRQLLLVDEKTFKERFPELL